MLTRKFFRFISTASFMDCFGLGGGIAIALAIIGAIASALPFGEFLLIGLLGWLVADFVYCIVSTIHGFLYPIFVTRPRERRQQAEAAEQARLALIEAARAEEKARVDAARLEAERIAAYERLFTEDDEDAESPFEEIEERRRESRAS